MLNAIERRRRAIRAAKAVAERFDIRHTRPVILQDRNHTLVHLSPVPIVAKVSVEKIFRRRSSSLSRELEVARLLIGAGASVIQPSTIFPSGPYAVDGMELTFWTYCSGSLPTDDFHAELGAALKRLHDMLKLLSHQMPPLPSFTLQLEEAGELLARPDLLPKLSDIRRTFLRELQRNALEKIQSLELDCRVLHGECNAQQALITSSGPVWLDFEAACVGPIEWDLANMPDPALRAYGLVDRRLLSLIRAARLICTTTWCWTQPDRAPEIRDAAEHHLAWLERHYHANNPFTNISS